MTIDDAADYIIMKLDEAKIGLNVLKLQKLVYYAQAWHWAIYKDRMFVGKFQAWIHGPVSRQLYDRFAGTKSLYSQVGHADMRPDFDPTKLTQQERSHLDVVLEAYATLTGDQLEEMTHSEDPWQQARHGYSPAQRCEVEIDEFVMRDYYAARLS